MTDMEKRERAMQIASIAATLEAGDRAAVVGSGEDAGQCHRVDAKIYVARARALVAEAEAAEGL